MHPSKKIAVTDLSFNRKILAKYRMGKRNPSWLPTMIFKNVKPFFLNQRLIQGWLPLSLHTKHFFFLLLKSIPDGHGLPLMERVDKKTPGSFLGKVTQPLEKALFWIRRESKPGDPFNLPWLKWMPERIRLLLGSLASPAMIRTLPRPSIGKKIDPRMGSDSRKDKGLRPQPEKPKGKERDPLVQGVPLSPGDKMVAFGRGGSRIPPVTFGLYPSSIRNRVPLKKGHDSTPDRVMRSQPQRRRSKLPDQFLIETSPTHWVYEKHLFSLALMESLSQAQIHIPSSRKMQTSDIASSPRRTGYGADERDYFFRKQDLHSEIENLKKSVAMTQKVLEERERRPHPLHELDITGHINIHHLADQVYRSMERRITVDRERRGIY